MGKRRRSRANKIQQWKESPFVAQIDALSHEGRGIAKQDGKTVFIEGALVGEQVQCIYTDKRSKFDEAKTIEILTPSDHRVDPPCEHAGYCGGCSLQHLDPAQAIKLKQDVLIEQLTHFAGAQPEEGFYPPLTHQTVSYRRKARLAVKHVPAKGGVLVGFREKGHRYVADINACEVLDARVGQLITPLKTLVDTLELKAEIPQIEVAMGDEGVALIFRHLAPISAADVEKLIEFANKHRLQIYLQPKGLETIHKVFPDDGDERLYYALNDFDLTFEFHPADFTQVNAGINESMVSMAIELMALKPTDRVLDLFCGLGNFTLPLARQAAEVVGVEGSELMVQRGYDNAKRNQISNVAFYADDLISEPKKDKANPEAPVSAIDGWNSEWATRQFDKILLDPPRSGAQQVVSHIEAFGAKRIVYVSCNPATLARDTGILIEKGYRLVKAGVMDMFPHTAHVESIALFEKN